MRHIWLRGPDPVQLQEQQDLPAGDVRDNAPANLSALSSDEDAPITQGRPRRRKRPLAQLINENQEICDRFMKTKMPEIL